MKKIETSSKFNGRRAFLKVAATGAAATLSPATSVLAINEKTADELITDSARKAIDKGLRFLSGRQIQRGADKGAFGASGYAGSVGICGLGGLAFMSEGSTPGVGRYGKQVDLCTDFLMRHTGPTGYIARGSGAIGNMYAHGFAMLCMSQAYGMSRKKRVRPKA